MRLGLDEDEFDPDELASRQEWPRVTEAVERPSSASGPPSIGPEAAPTPHSPRTVFEVHPESIARLSSHREMPEDGQGDRLRLLEVIASGGMGVIHRGRDADLNRDVAVKVLQDQHRDHPEIVRRFVEEAQIAGQLQHPGVVPIHELGVFADRRPYFVMKLVRGQTLAEILAEQAGPAPDRHRLLPIFLQVAQTVAYAHAHGVVHCDLSPSNVMVGKFGEVQVMDWGLAQVAFPRDRASAEGDATSSPVDGGPEGRGRPGGIMGTPGYMAPEQFTDSTQQADPRADVFALGSLLCEILTGHPAYDGFAARKARNEGVRPEPSEAPARLRSCGADEELVALVCDCVSADPTRRPSDAGELAARLTAYLDGVGDRLRLAELARVEALARADGERKRRRLTALLAVLAVALVALAAGSYAEWLQRRQARRAASAIVLRDVELLRDEAAADPTGDPEKWRSASIASMRTTPMLADAPRAMRERLSLLGEEVERGFNRAEADRRLLDRLDLIRYRADEGELAVADAQFAAAFREAGLDLSASGPAEIGRALASRPHHVKEAIIAVLDCWAIVRRDREPRGRDEIGPWQVPLEAARAADPDPWRNRLRDALETGDRQALARLASAGDIEGRPAPSLWLMGRLLIWSGQIEAADAFLARAWRIHPHDFWINLELSRSLMIQPWQPELALNYATSAVSLRPESAVAHLRLGWIHQCFANKVGAEAEYRAALRLWPDYGRAHARLAGLLFFRSRRAEAADEYRTAIRLMPDEAEPYWVSLGDCLMRLHRLEEAAGELAEAS